MTRKILPLLITVALACTWGCSDDDHDLPDPTVFTKRVVVTDLLIPIGMAVDERGQFWVSESGTGRSDARISLITREGTHHVVFTGFTSVVANGNVEGIGHVAYKDGKLYILDGGAGKLYIVDVSSYTPGDPPRAAQDLTSQNIGAFVLSQQLTNPLNTNLYNLTFGPGGHLYITDSGANAIIKRDKVTTALSVFARIPNVAPTTDAVPTGIVFDGSKFLVSTLSGAPFLPGAARLYQVSTTGQVGIYQSNFTTLTDVVLTANNKPLALQYGRFSLVPPTIGFVRMSGLVTDETGLVLADNLDLPTDIERYGARVYYVLSRGDGTITRLSY